MFNHNRFFILDTFADLVDVVVMATEYKPLL